LTIRKTAAGHAFKRGQGRAVWFLGGLLTWKAVGSDTQGHYELVEQLGKRGFASPIHTHERETEGFYILEGNVSFILGSKTISATPGSFLYVPQQTKHGFVVESEEAKFLVLISPSGLESFFDEIGKPAKSLTLPPPLESTPSPEQIEAVAVKYGQKFFGPPPTPDLNRQRKVDLKI